MNAFRTLILTAAVGCAGVAHARPDPSLDIQFSYDGLENGIGWFDFLPVVASGGQIFVRVVMNIPDSFHGIRGARYNITTDVGHWDSGGNDIADLSAAKGSANDGRIAGFDFGGQTQQIFESGNRLRIDAKGDTADNPNAGISTSQNTPGALGAAFNTAKTATVFKFSVFLNPNWSGFVRFRIADGGNNGPIDEITSFAAYETAASTSGTQISGAVGDTGFLIIPAPSSALMLFVPLAAMSRRRRR